jgi:two-component system response regulator DesR
MPKLDGLGVVAELARAAVLRGRDPYRPRPPPHLKPAVAADALTAPECPLSQRELEVLRLAGRDALLADIACQAHLSHGTVRNHMTTIVTKLGAANRSEAYRSAREQGWA